MQISIKTKGPTINGENEEKKIFQIAGENRLILEKLLPHSICGYDLLLVPERLSSGQRTQANKNKNKNKERHTTEHLNLNYISGTHTQYLIYEYATCCLLHTSYDVRISIWKSVLAPTHIYTGILYSFHLVFHFIPMRWKWRAYVSSAEITRELCKAFTAEFAFCACLLQTYIISASGLLTNNIRNSNHFSFRRYIIILIRFVFLYVCLFFFFVFLPRHHFSFSDMRASPRALDNMGPNVLICRAMSSSYGNFVECRHQHHDQLKRASFLRPLFSHFCLFCYCFIYYIYVCQDDLLVFDAQYHVVKGARLNGASSASMMMLLMLLLLCRVASRCSNKMPFVSVIQHHHNAMSFLSCWFFWHICCVGIGCSWQAYFIAHAPSHHHRMLYIHLLRHTI